MKHHQDTFLWAVLEVKWSKCPDSFSLMQIRVCPVVDAHCTLSFQRMLVFRPDRRISSRVALNHPYFRDDLDSIRTSSSLSTSENDSFSDGRSDTPVSKWEAFVRTAGTVDCEQIHAPGENCFSIFWHQNKLGNLPFQQPPVPVEVARNHRQEDSSCDRLSMGQQINSALFSVPQEILLHASGSCCVCAWLVLAVFIYRPFSWPWKLCWKQRETASEAEWKLCVKDRMAWRVTALSSEWNGLALSRNTCSATENGVRVSKRFPDSAGCLTVPGVVPQRPDLEHLCTISLEDSVAESGFLFGGLSDTLL